MWSVFDSARADKFLVLFGEQLEHAIAADKCRCPEWDLQLVAAAVVIPTNLFAALWDLHSKKRRNSWWVPMVHGAVYVPSIEVGVLQIIFFRNWDLVKCLVVRVLQRDISQAFVWVNVPTSNDLDLWLVGNCLQVCVQDAALVDSLAMAVGTC